MELQEAHATGGRYLHHGEREQRINEHIHGNAVQQHDLMNFRLIGQKEFIEWVSSVVLTKSSVKAPNRLQTFSEKKVTKLIQVTQEEKDSRHVSMKKKMKFSIQLTVQENN